MKDVHSSPPVTALCVISILETVYDERKHDTPCLRRLVRVHLLQILSPDGNDRPDKYVKVIL